MREGEIEEIQQPCHDVMVEGEGEEEEEGASQQTEETGAVERVERTETESMITTTSSSESEPEISTETSYEHSVSVRKLSELIDESHKDEKLTDLLGFELDFFKISQETITFWS